MNNTSEKVLLPNDVRKLLNADNKEIVELCKKTSVAPKKNKLGQIYFSIDEVKKLKSAKSSLIAGNGIKKMEKETLPVMTKPNSQAVVNGLLDTLNKMESNITTSMTKLIDEKLEGMDEVVVELIRCKTDNETLKQKIIDLNKEIYQLKNDLNSYKPIGLGLYKRKERHAWE